MKVALITCYFDPDYVRARSLRAALATMSDVETVVIKNKHKGLLRYFEVFSMFAAARRQKPDVYLLTFRGQEILPLLLLYAGKTPVIFDEFIVPLAWTLEKGRAKTLPNMAKHVLATLSAPLYKSWLRRCRFILSDTDVHAELSAQLSGVLLSKYRTLPVGTDETVFTPKTVEAEKHKKQFTVFYYANMLPLHGLSYVLEAATLLADKKDINFIISGGGKAAAQAVAQVNMQGGRITHHYWIPFEELPSVIHSVDLCLAGPFGNTGQAQRVITGKSYQFMAAGMPTVIGKNQAGQPFFKDKADCLLVDQGSAEALSQVIEWAYKNRTKLPAIGKDGRRLYESRFSNAVIAKSLRQLLDELDVPASS